MSIERIFSTASRGPKALRHNRGFVTFCWGIAVSLGLPILAAYAGDWTQLGGSPERNAVSTASGLPVEFEPGDFDADGNPVPDAPGKNILWTARLGTETYGTPVVAGDKVFCATNNGAGYLERVPAEEDCGCLIAFHRDDGRFLWQYTAPVLGDESINWPEQGICSTPLVEGERLWIVTNRCEVVCLDTEGFRDGENDGPVTDEESTDEKEADVVWRFDMRAAWNVHPLYMTASSVTAVGDLLFVCTSNGTDEKGVVVSPEAPSFAAFDKNSGEPVWTSNLPGKNILQGQWSSPAAGVLGGVPQVLFAGGDGWVYAFRADARSNPPELLWKFDANPKTALYKKGGLGDRNYPIAAPVIAGERVYISTGCDPQLGDGQGDFWCIEPGTRRGDISAELVVDAEGKPVPPARERAVDPEAGQKVIPNPNSAVVWHYRGEDVDGNGKIDYEEVFHRTLGSPVVVDGLVIVGDFSGIVHCFDAETGKHLWYYDMFASVWASPLAADGKIYLPDEDGDVAVFRMTREPADPLAENMMLESIYGSPTAVDGVLYIAARNHLFAVAAKDARP
ncbi:hypothetical protein JCM19992_09760 [Thermostilla marina]